MLPLHSLIVLSPDVIHVQRDQIGQNCAKEEQICMTVTELMTQNVEHVEGAATNRN